MSRRIEIELTSQRADETWTWRAAGALQPRGVVEQKLLPSGSKVGDVLRVEIEMGLEGIAVSSVLPMKVPHKEPQRIEIAVKRPETFEGVITTLIPKSEKRGRERRHGFGDDDTRSGRPNARPGARPSGRPERRPAAPSTLAERPRTERTRTERVQRDETATTVPEGSRRPTKTSRPRPPRLVPKTVHRDALISSLPPEQRPIAEQLALGGLPAVRRALSEQQNANREGGRPEVGGEAIITLAEQLLPSVREATWLDRAEAALARLDTISLRDLRATVTGASPRNPEGKEALNKLRATLDERLTKLREKWEQEINHALEEGRVLQALRLSAKPPEPSTRFPSNLVEPLATAAGASLTESTQPERWIALLDAAANSPIRRLIKPSGMPADPTNAVRQAASGAAGRVPALAKLLGLAIPPPPRPMMNNRPVTATPANHVTANSVRTDADPADSGPAEAAPADSGPAEAAPADSGPAEAAPADSGPTETARNGEENGNSIPSQSAALDAHVASENA